MKRTIFSKILTSYFLIILILSSSIFIFSFRTIRNFYVDTLKNDLINNGITLNLKIIPLIREKKFDDLERLVDNLDREINTRITVINTDGIVLADSENEPDDMENHKSRIEIKEALAGRTGHSVRFSSTMGKDMLYVAIPIEIDNETAGVLRLSLFLSQIDDLFRRLRIELIEIILIIVTVSLLGAIIFSRSISKPIKELTDASQKVAKGDFDVKVFLKKDDELKELSESFNYMTSRIKELFLEVSSQKEEMRRLIASIQDAILVLDKDDVVKLSNDNCRNIFKDTVIDGKHYWEISKNVELNEIINQVKDEKK